MEFVWTLEHLKTRWQRSSSVQIKPPQSFILFCEQAPGSPATIPWLLVLWPTNRRIASAGLAGFVEEIPCRLGYHQAPTESRLGTDWTWVQKHLHGLSPNDEPVLTTPS
jgi:hypothetical protein